MRKENARLQGQLECCSKDAGAGSASEAELEQLRRELQEIRREKVRLEVDLATTKSSDEYDALAAEACQLREECSGLRRAKLDAELSLEKSSAQLEVAQAQAARAEHATNEMTILKVKHDDLQVQFQRVQAQKTALEERSQGDEATRGELRELRLEKIRLEGDLETSKMKEAAIAEKLRNSERAAMELAQQRQRVMAAESELDVSRKQVNSLKEQVAQLANEGRSSRTDSLDQLRNELLSRIEKPRPSALPHSTSGFEEAEPDMPREGERKTLLNQRALFEQLKQQFNDAKAADASPAAQAAEEDMQASAARLQQRELELEEELRQVRKENVELSIRIQSLEDEARSHKNESSTVLASSAAKEAEIHDLRLQVEQEISATRRQGSEIVELQDKLAAATSDAASAKRRLTSVEEDLHRAEDDAKATQLKARRLEDEASALQRKCSELQAQLGDAQAGREALTAQIEAHKADAEHCRSNLEHAERRKIEVESRVQMLESESERLRAELLDANAEKAKIKQVVEDLMRAEEANKTEELKKELQQAKSRASYFEREYNASKSLNSEMTRVMSQMTQAVAEKSDEKGDFAQQNRLLQKQLELKSQEVRTAKLERDDVQKQLDALQSTGTYYQDRYRDSQEELRNLRHEHSISSATSSKLKLRVESLQKEIEDIKSQNAKLNYEARAVADDTSKIDRYELHVKELQQRLKQQDEELDKSQAFAAKSQAVNDCLNTLLVLETEQTSLYEASFSVSDPNLSQKFDMKKNKAQSVISRLNEIMSEEERPSIAYMDQRYR